MELNKVYNMDCIEGMQLLEDNSIDLIIADPPYNIKKAEWDKWKTQNDYLDWMGKWIIEAERVLKDNGSFYWFHNQMPVISQLMNWIENRTELIFKQMIVWDKWNNEIKKGNNLQGAFYKIVHNPALRNYPKMAEYCLFYTLQNETGSDVLLKEIKYSNIFRPIRKKLLSDFKKSGLSKNELVSLFLKEGRYSSLESAKCHASYKIGWNEGQRFDLMDKKMYDYLNKFLCFSHTYEDLRREYEDLRLEYESLRYTFNQVNNQTSVWTYPVPNLNERLPHETQKPLELVENIIKHSSNSNDIILDPFMGSGTTAHACKNLNRNYIGFEISPTYCDLINERLKTVEKPLTAF